MRTTGDRWHEESERNLVRDGVAVGLTLAVGLGAYLAAGSAACFADELEAAQEAACGVNEEWQDEWDEAVGCLNAYDGVYYDRGRTETYYSSEVLYHWRTPEWWIDEDGFYRTDEGYYVVAVSEYEMEEGTVFEGSRGLCQVLDCGCDAGVTDYYVAW